MLYLGGRMTISRSFSVNIDDGYRAFVNGVLVPAWTVEITGESEPVPFLITALCFDNPPLRN